MATVQLYNQAGAVVGKMELTPALFDVPMNDAVLYEAVVAQQANSRVAIADTKDRSEVRGGGKKPWKQKGTGRARHGSTRSPIWKGGGVTFGPTSDRNFSRKLNRKVRRKAMAMALTDAVVRGRFIVVDDLTLPEKKTRVVARLLAVLPHVDSRTLIIVEPLNKTVGVAGRNIPDLNVVPANALSIVDVLKAKRLVASKAAIEALQTLLTKKK